MAGIAETMMSTCEAAGTIGEQGEKAPHKVIAVRALHTCATSHSSTGPCCAACEVARTRVLEDMGKDCCQRTDSRAGCPAREHI